jgi:hypothetical protein
MTETTFKITTPHSDGCMHCGWFFPNGWRGVGPLEKRDRAGRRAGKREGFLPDWFVLMCNSPGCNGRAAVPVRLVTDFAESLDPSIDFHHSSPLALAAAAAAAVG